MADIKVRSERVEDRLAISEIESAAFGSALEATLVDALRESAHPFVSLVAEIDGKPVGHVSFSPVTVAGTPTVSAAQLAPLAVQPAYQRRGVGAALIRRGLTACLEAGWRAVFLVGDPRYYSRFGFQLAGPLGLHLPGPYDEYLQFIELEAGTLNGCRGDLRLHPAFDGL
jgi:putative acetyltransferase